MTRVAAEILLKLKIVKFSHFYLIMLLKHIFSLDISTCPLALKKRHEVQAKQNQIPWTGIQQFFCMARHDKAEIFFMLFSPGSTKHCRVHSLPLNAEPKIDSGRDVDNKTGQ